MSTAKPMAINVPLLLIVSALTGLFAPRASLYLIPHINNGFNVPTHSHEWLMFRQGFTVEQVLLRPLGLLPLFRVSRCRKFVTSTKMCSHAWQLSLTYLLSTVHGINLVPRVSHLTAWERGWHGMGVLFVPLGALLGISNLLPFKVNICFHWRPG